MTTKPGDPQERLKAKFLGVADERVSRIHEDLAHLGEHPEEAEIAARVMREIHTLKGESKMLGFSVINDVAHRTEDLLAVARARGTWTEGKVGQHIVIGLDLISALIEHQGRPEGPLENSISRFYRESSSLTGSAAAADTAADTAADADADTTADTTADAAPDPAPDTPAAVAKAGAKPSPKRGGRTSTTRASDDDRPEPASERGGERRGEDFVRIEGSMLSGLTLLGSQLALRQDEMDRLISDSRRLVGEWMRELDVRRFANRGPRQGSVSLGDVSRLYALGRELMATLQRARENAFESHLRLQELQDDVRAMRLLQVGQTLHRFSRAARELAGEQGKQVRVVVEGADVAVDKQVIDRLADPLLHLVRNSVDHGIEAPGERRASGKPEQGMLWLSAREAGGDVEIEVRDDGRGIDPLKVVRAAVTRGALSEDEALSLEPAAALALIFRAGVSTRQDVSDVSGRGVGLDVVKKNLEELGGTITVDARMGEGTRFLLRVPVSVALAAMFVVRAGDGLYAFPSTAVRSAMRVQPSEIESAGDGHAIALPDGRVPVIDLGALLGGAPARAGDSAQLVVLQHEGSRVALRVSSFLGEREIVQRGRDPFLAGCRLLGGTAVLEGGRLVLALRTAELFRLVAESSGATRTTITEREAEARCVVLIVDDSELTREMIASLLDRHGFETLEAVDGHDALTAIHRRRPDVVVTDLDMPVLDGFGLIKKLRADRELRDLPVIVMSTRGSEDDKRQAMESGADAYVVKSSFHEAKFISLVASYGPSRGR